MFGWLVFFYPDKVSILHAQLFFLYCDISLSLVFSISKHGHRKLPQKAVHVLTSGCFCKDTCKSLDLRY